MLLYMGFLTQCHAEASLYHPGTCSHPVVDPLKPAVGLGPLKTSPISQSPAAEKNSGALRLPFSVKIPNDLLLCWSRKVRYMENPRSLSQTGQLWLVLALFIGVRQMEKKPHLCRGPCVWNLLLIHAILSVEDALQSNTE